MNRSFAAAAVLSLMAMGIRTLDGQTEILPAASSELTDETLLGFFHLTWYLVTVVFAVAAGALGYLSFSVGHAGSRVVGVIIGVLFISWAVTIALVSNVFVWHPGTVIPMLVTFLIGSLAMYGAIGGQGTATDLGG